MTDAVGYADSNTLYLDSFVFSKLAADPQFKNAATQWILDQKYTLVFSVINLIELYPHSKRRDAILDFICSVPFAIASNIEHLIDEEVRLYPKAAKLPLVFSSKASKFNAAQLRYAIAQNLEERISSFKPAFANATRSTFNTILQKRDSGEVSFTKPDEIHLFLMSSVLSMLNLDYGEFLKREKSAGRAIETSLFRVYNLQALAIYTEFYKQNKKGKESDIPDFMQLGFVPYLGLSVLDNERVDMLNRISRMNLGDIQFKYFNLAEFRSLCYETSKMDSHLN